MWCVFFVGWIDFNTLWFSCSAGRSLRLRTRRSHMSTRNTENTVSLYWFGPPESNTLRPVVGLDCLRIGRDDDVTKGVASSALYWPADEVGSQTPGRLRLGDLSLCYTSCHILSNFFGHNPPRSCLVRQVLTSWQMRSSEKSSGRSSRGRVGHQLGRLGPLTGRQVF
jgi:hypothetical protein